MAAISFSRLLKSVPRLHRCIVSSSSSHLPSLKLSSSSRFSTSADYIETLKSSDERVKRNIECEIRRVEDYDMDRHRPRKVGSDYVCPFEIVDKPGYHDVIFKRDFGTEKIEIRAHFVYKKMEYVLTILKEDGSLFKMTDDASYNIDVDDCTITCEAPDGSPSNWFHEVTNEYLKMRGIDYTFSCFMDNYLIDRYKREYLNCLRRFSQILD